MHEVHMDNAAMAVAIAKQALTSEPRQQSATHFKDLQQAEGVCSRSALTQRHSGLKVAAEDTVSIPLKQPYSDKAAL
jgi:hypothetical protein